MESIAFRPVFCCGRGQPSSVAVLPLQNLSGDPANDYFSDGMSEEIGTKLSRIQGFNRRALRLHCPPQSGTEVHLREIAIRN